jgi:predicted  nucleic acid-binding Zn-ribbon protein
MPTTADSLRELHGLHQRAKAIRDRLSSGPKTVASRQAVLARRQADLNAARDALKHLKSSIKSKETQTQSIRARVDDLRAKLNVTKKQVEYDAIRNQIATDNLAASKLEDETLELMGQVEAKEAELKGQESEVAKLAAEVEALTKDVEGKAEGQRSQLAELERAIVEAENIIPADVRDQYRRVVKGRGAEGMSPVEHGACSACYVSVTTQMRNELINGESLVFCKSCGNILYLAEEEANALRRR